MRQLKITKSITSRDSQSLDKYLQEIGREQLLTVEEEVELSQRIRKKLKLQRQCVKINQLKKKDTQIFLIITQWSQITKD